jgi:hypothetical protein
VTTTLVDDIAAHIRYVDAGYELSPYQLGSAIAEFLLNRGVITPAQVQAVEDFAERPNRGAGYKQPKPMGAGRLAELLVAEFDLDKDN